MRVVVDVNFSVGFAERLARTGIDAIHWTAIGAATATDAEILDWARHDGRVVVTQDLDYPEILALTGAPTPSVVLVRGADALAPGLVDAVTRVLRQCSDALEKGAVVSLNARGHRVRILPLA